MPTVIDALVVTLGLDASQFQRSTRDTSEGIRKFRQDVTSGATDVERQARRMQDAFGGVERAIMRLGTVFLGFAGGIGFVTFLGNVQKSIAELYRLGQTLGQSGQDLYRWQQVGAQVGATAEDITGSYQKMVQSINDYLSGSGQLNAYFRYFAQHGVQFTGPGGARSQTEIYTQLNKAVQGMPPQRAESFLRNLGLGPGTVQMLMQSPEKLSADLGRFKTPSANEMKDAAIAQAKFNEAWSEFLRISTSIGNTALPVINKLFTEFARDLDNLGKEIEAWMTTFRRFDKWFSETWIGRMAAKLLGQPVSSGHTPGSVSDRFGNWQGGRAGGAFGTQPSPGQDPGSSGMTGGGSNQRSDAGGSNTTQSSAANMQGNEWLKQQREKNVAEINNNPALKGKLMKLLEAEEGNNASRTATMEALLNRTAMIQQRNPDWTVEKEMRSGFYGPVNRAGGLDRFGGGMTAASRQNSETAFANAAGGSNIIMGRTDQGTRAGRGDPNAYGPGQVDFPGKGSASVFNYWKGRRPGAGDFTHADSEKYAAYLNRGATGSNMQHPTTAGVGGVGGGGGGAWDRMRQWWNGGGQGQQPDNWGNNLRAVPWLQNNGMSIIKGIPTNTSNNSSTSETHIGQFTVMTEPRSNPWSMAAQIKDAVQRSNIMDNSNSGPN